MSAKDRIHPNWHRKEKGGLDYEPYYQAILDAKQLTQSAIDEYRQNPPQTQKGLAEAEQKLWEAVPKDLVYAIRNSPLGDKCYERYVAMVTADLVGKGETTLTPFRNRARILVASKGCPTDLIFEYLDQHPDLVSKSSTMDVINAAKRDYIKNGDTAQCLQTFVNGVAKAPLAKQIRNKRRSQPGPKTPKSVKEEPPIVQPQPAPKAIPPKESKRSSATELAMKESKDLWLNIQDSVMGPLTKLVHDRLDDRSINENTITELLEDFQIGVHVCYQNVLVKIRDMQRRGPTQLSGVSQEKVLWAGEMLYLDGIPPPHTKGRGSWRPDPDKVKKAYWKLSVRYHPDKVGDDPQYKERYLAIQEAYQYLQQI